MGVNSDTAGQDGNWFDVADTHPVISLHSPDVIAPESCAERCGGLAKYVGETTLAAAQNPNEQFAVVCKSAKLLGCNAVVFSVGSYATIEDTKVFLPEPNRSYGYGKRGNDVHTTIEIARSNGASDIPFDAFRRPIA